MGRSIRLAKVAADFAGIVLFRTLAITQASNAITTYIVKSPDA